MCFGYSPVLQLIGVIEVELSEGYIKTFSTLSGIRIMF